MRYLSAVAVLLTLTAGAAAADVPERHLLYVATPGMRNDTQYGGAGVLILDIDRDYAFVRRIAVPALGNDHHAEPVRGVCACAATGGLYVSTLKTLSCIDLANDKVLWERTYPDGCDRMSITPDGKTIYEPTAEGKYWHVLNAADGEEVAKINTGAGAHNTICSRDGRYVYLAGLQSPLLGVADTTTNKVDRSVGPFSNVIRPFTVDGRGRRCYVCLNELLGFEIGDLENGKKLHRIEAQGFSAGPTKRHGCPSHGVGLTPDEREIWLTDAHNRRLHIFDNTVDPPKQVASVAVRDEPSWITFSIDGRWCYSSTGEVIDVKTRKVAATLKDERGRDVQSEKLLEIDFAGDKPVRNGDQFGVGRL